MDLKNSKYLSLSRQKAINNFIFEKDKERCLLAGLLVRKVVNETTGVGVEEQCYLKSENGKPWISNSNIKFNLSHSDRKIITGVCDEELGVDVEKIQEAPFQIMKMVFHNNEIEYVNNSQDSDRSRRFYKIWTRKEAYCKCSGSGIDDKIKMLDTTDVKLDELFHTWENDGYCYSVFTGKKSIIKKYSVDVADINKFFSCVKIDL
ncbi:MAG: 4'-phosphopantetheinyl transferase superfamily protein [Pseudobutyrivibrio sp.]|uniref:4'-phosphopantetheinyl transferase family protein n=1 Tax=Pseudobutyrivibrio sp. TaxID=2014367 RepID=UPI0025E4FA90|nr:4'-phosphopantetheinyl transferase superfamily protein [Pseudobutyrivibrio sp.]MBQ8489790.1 4'-phosphopantetheinyl transferase superfamily protein [Pseudobutyrivibrio sp.]